MLREKSHTDIWAAIQDFRSLQLGGCFLAQAPFKVRRGRHSLDIRRCRNIGGCSRRPEDGITWGFKVGFRV